MGHKFEMVCKVCIWLGRDLDSGEHIGAMVEWISDGRRYEIGPIIKSRTAEVYDDEFPLSMEPRGA